MLRSVCHTIRIARGDHPERSKKAVKMFYPFLVLVRGAERVLRALCAVQVPGFRVQVLGWDAMDDRTA